MRILHYFLGFPPYRTGGLTKFAYDLMQTQSTDGNSVIALWPGRINPFIRHTKIAKRKSVDNIENYEIINPLPVPLDEGINEIRLFIKETDKTVYTEFLSSVRPDAIHIHTLMGLHKEFIQVANDLKIKTVYTTHDYFGICPKVTLFRTRNICNNPESCTYCTECNITALSYRKIILLQSPLYKLIKNSFVVKKLRQMHRKSFFDNSLETINPKVKASAVSIENYKTLRKYYTDILEMIDLIHFNSSVAENVYKRFIKPKNSVRLTISNKEIVNRTSLKKNTSVKLRFTFLSPAKAFKGYYWLTDSLNRMWKEGNHDFILNLYTNVPVVEPYMRISEGGFSREQLTDIFKNTDVLVAPSIWYETFGFTVLEALSFGVPVIVSDNVGAKDIIGESGIIVDSSDYDSLYRVLLDAKNLKFSGNVKISEWNEFVKLNNNNYR